MAHHIAQLLAQANKEQDPKRLRAIKAEIADLVLRIWANRHQFGERIDPLVKCRKAAEVLASVHPSTNRYFAHPNQLVEQTESRLQLAAVAQTLVLITLRRVVPPTQKRVGATVDAALDPAERDLLREIERVSQLIVAAEAIVADAMKGDAQAGSDPEAWLLGRVFKITDELRKAADDTAEGNPAATPLKATPKASPNKARPPRRRTKAPK